MMGDEELREMIARVKDEVGDAPTETLREKVDRLKAEIADNQELVDFIRRQPSYADLSNLDRERLQRVEDRLDYNRYLVRLLERRTGGSPN